MVGGSIRQWLYGPVSFRPEPRPNGLRAYQRRLRIDWPIWLSLAGFALAQPAWGARSTSFRGQWSLGSLIGSLVILGILAALVVFFMWPRQGGQ
jgi:hypothetical protein